MLYIWTHKGCRLGPQRSKCDSFHHPLQEYTRHFWNIDACTAYLYDFRLHQCDQVNCISSVFHRIGWQLQLLSFHSSRPWTSWDPDSNNISEYEPCFRSLISICVCFVVEKAGYTVVKTFLFPECLIYTYQGHTKVLGPRVGEQKSRRKKEALTHEAQIIFLGQVTLSWLRNGKVWYGKLVKGIRKTLRFQAHTDRDRWLSSNLIGVTVYL